MLIDAVGARYSVPSILPTLREKGIVAAVFNGNVIMGLRLPYANLRTHRKILVVDGRVAFSGGMNIREGFTREFAGESQSHDTHFKITVPWSLIFSRLLRKTGASRPRKCWIRRSGISRSPTAYRARNHFPRLLVRA